MTGQPSFLDTPVATPAAMPAMLDDSVLRQAIESARDGITISDARHPEKPLVYINPAFERMTGYSADEVIGLNCRFLQGDDSLQAEIDTIRRALRSGSSCIVTIRNYRRDGKLFYNELSMSPVRDRDGNLTHFIGIQKDVTRRVRAEQRLRDRDRELQRVNSKLERLARCDGLTGLLNRRTFNDCLDREWRRTLREGGYLSLYMLDVDNYKSINDRHGHAVCDTCLRRVAAVLEECFGRASDFVARYGGDEFVVLNAGMDHGAAVAQGQKLLTDVRSMSLPAAVDKLTVSIGLCTIDPDASNTPDGLLQAADTALYEAKNAGRDQLAVTPRA
ncbi:MAG: diguanylate cyclase [Gammaproteobacteria bacterium]|nr:diguanylate cyclase [Gammaproteobacteria bacterium]